jgi:hypothetical protein
MRIDNLIIIQGADGPSEPLESWNPKSSNPINKGERQGKQKVRRLAKPLIIKASKPLSAGEYY